MFNRKSPLDATNSIISNNNGVNLEITTNPINAYVTLLDCVLY